MPFKLISLAKVKKCNAHYWQLWGGQGLHVLWVRVAAAAFGTQLV